MFRKMPFILVVIIIATVLLEPLMPFILKQIFYSISLTIKSLIVFLLPLIIFCLLFKAVVMFSSNATKIIFLIITLVCLSNFLSTFLSHYIGMWIYKFDISIIKPEESYGLMPLWSLEIPNLIANNKAMFFGIFLGLILSKLRPQESKSIAIKTENFVSFLLTNFIYFIPLFVAGFVVKLQYDGTVGIIFRDYIKVFISIAIAQFGYILFVYLLLNKFSIRNFLNNINNMLPATVSGFSTMSSAASMPLTIIGAEKNAKNKDLARSVIPITVNVHLVGDCFAIPIFAYAVLKSFGMEEPSLLTYLTFSFYFVLAKFSVAAIPGGGILVMLPILESHLGFNGEMMSLITALYILFDPEITSANVLGNGAFAKMIDNLSYYFEKKTNSLPETSSIEK